MRQRPARGEAREVRPDPIRQRQVRAQCDQRPKLQPFEFDLRGVHAIHRTVAPGKREVGGVEPLAVERREGQGLREDFPLHTGFSRAHPAGKMRERDFGKVRRQCRLDVGELDVGDELEQFLAGHFEPDAQRAGSARDFSRQRQPLPPRRDIRIVETHEQRPLRVLPVLHRFELEIAPQIERRREVGGRRAFQSETVAPEPVLQAELDAVEHELGRVAQIVVPHDERVADDDLALPKNPVGERQFVGRLRRIEFESRDAQHAGTIAPDGKPRPVDDEFLQAKLGQRQRRPRDDHFQLGKEQERRGVDPRPIEHAKSLDDELRIPAIPAGGQGRNLHRLPELARKHSGDRVAIGFDLRKDDESDHEQRQRERRETDDDDGPDEPDQRVGSRARCAENGTRGRHNGGAPAL